MDTNQEISPKEIERRRKISEARKKAIEKKRIDGLKRYWRGLRKKKREREKLEAKEKEKEKKRKEKEREKLKRKKAAGRKKKPGPKINKYARRKKAKEAEKKKLAREEARRIAKIINYKVIICRNGLQYELAGEFHDIKDAYELFKKLQLKSNTVELPRVTKIYNDIEPSIDECILIEKTDNGPTILRNEYGKLVEHRTNLDGWEVIDKFKYNVEETFWVFGYDNRGERKTAPWIYNELIIGDGFGFYEFRRLFTFRNKLLIRYDDGSLKIVICKTEFDAVRLYNFFQEKAKKDKVKQLIFVGDRSTLSEETWKLVRELMTITGWTQKKVLMKETSYMNKK